MLDKKKSQKIEETILQLFSEITEIDVAQVASKMGLSKSNETERKAIRRVFNSLIDRQILRAKGKARARVYLKVDMIEAPHFAIIADSQSGEADTFNDIFITEKSKTLLHYVSKPQKNRLPVGYNQNFLRAYKPNKTFYLTQNQRDKLLEIGRVEIKTRPAGTYARNILDRLLIDLSWNSSRLEGNTYSLLETKRLIELGETAAGKDASEAQMILNHKAAIEYIVDTATDDKITSHEVCSIHALLSENLLGDPGASGRVRTIAVGIGGTTYIPIDNPHVLNDCFRLFIEKVNLIKNPFEQSFFSFVQLSYLQAFEDVNKRTARLVANIPLIRENLKPLSFIDVDQSAYVKALLGVYEKNDISLICDLYIWAYTRSSQRYTAIQQSMAEPNLLRLKYRSIIHKIVRSLILEKVNGSQVVSNIQSLIEAQELADADRHEIFKIIETEIMSLHEGNIARFKVTVSEFQAWKKLQKY